MAILVNNIIVYDDNTSKRILWIDKDEKYIFWIDMAKKNALPEIQLYQDIINDINSGYAQISKEDNINIIINEENLTSAEIEKRDKAWCIIEKIVDKRNYPRIFDSTYRGKVIKEITENQNISKTTIYKYLNRYWVGGQVKNALIPRYNNSGGRGRNKNLKDKKTGRPRDNIDIRGVGTNVTYEMIEIFEKSINKYYLSRKKLSLKKSYNLMITEYFTIKKENDDGTSILEVYPPDSRPTYGQFKYWYYKNRNLKDELSSRIGEKNFEMNHRALLGDPMKSIFGPGSLYQIDATIADIYLVSRYDRNKTVGRPTIYIVIDAYSRMITGMYIGFEHPSWVGAMMALSNCVVDKVEYCKTYGINIDDTEWNVRGMPDAILGDRGEMEGNLVETLINSLDVDIENTPAYRPDWKGIVENKFKTIQAEYKPFTPGYVDTDYQKRGGKDYRLDATLDIYEFTKMIIVFILNYNNKLIGKYSAEKNLIIDEVEYTPKSLWNWGIRNKTGILRNFPEDIVKLNLMPTAKASLTEYGIKFKNLLYTCMEIEKNDEFTKAAYNGQKKVDISYDTRNMDYIYIRLDNGRKYTKCWLIDNQEKYFNKTLSEIEHLRYVEKRTLEKQEDSQLNSMVNANYQAANIVKEAIKNTKKVQSKYESKSKKIKDIRTNRKLELEAERIENTFDLSNQTHSDNDIKKYVDESIKDNIDKIEELYEDEMIKMFESIQKERLDE